MINDYRLSATYKSGEELIEVEYEFLIADTKEDAEKLRSLDADRKMLVHIKTDEVLWQAGTKPLDYVHPALRNYPEDMLK